MCPACKDWMPSQGSKYYRCAKYAATRATCDEPLSACEACPYYEKPAEYEEPGRPNLSGIDWEDPDEVRDYKREYMRDYMRARRKAAKSEPPTS